MALDLEAVVSSPPLDDKHLASDAAKHFGWREETPMAAPLDPETMNWTRRYDDPNVVARREELRRLRYGYTRDGRGERSPASAIESCSVGQ